MTSTSAHDAMTPKDRANYGFARVRNAAYDAVQALWTRRKAEGLTQAQLAERLGKDAGWVSRNMRGPANWTLRTFGEFVEALDGEAEIVVKAIEDPNPERSNYDAYSEYEIEHPTATIKLTASSGVFSFGSQTTSTNSTYTIVTQRSIPPMSSFGAVIVCEDARREISGKDILIGVFSGSIVLPTFPAVISLALWIEYVPANNGRQTKEFFELRIRLEGKDPFKINVEVDYPSDQPPMETAIVINGIQLRIDEPSDLIIEALNKGELTELKRKGIIKGPTKANFPINMRSPPAV